ncbi:MAG TPA: DUF5998 family protein [Nocardioidaceae bacterium]|nr:DUF5998 family protein [Nocardioidaceae bacterium]
MPDHGHRPPDAHSRAAAVRPAGHPGPDRSDELKSAIDASGYHPTIVADGIGAALAGEPVRSFLVHHEPTFDREEIRRHETVVVMTPTRLIVAHTDEHAADDLLPQPYTSTTTEAIPLASVESVVVNRMVANPEKYVGESEPPTVSEAVLTVGWGAVGRVDLEPATCSDPNCEADHGYTGTLASDDFSLRMSSAADGDEAVEQVLSFAADLSEATARR